MQVITIWSKIWINTNTWTTYVVGFTRWIHTFSLARSIQIRSDLWFIFNWCIFFEKWYSNTVNTKRSCNAVSPESTICCRVGNLFLTLNDTLWRVITNAKMEYRTMLRLISLAVSSCNQNMYMWIKSYLIFIKLIWNVMKI